ncbi:MAG TPA: L-histidine N(alpha)-methyltransferase [Vicinamibacterales bacterium]|nr:L-histidine N(alpha)-methyltransferase [Vicinamibacterales bacterium]
MPQLFPARPGTPDPLAAAFARDVAEGFARRPRTVPPRWLYDDLGSALFDAICRLPWYRITRAERALLAAHGRAVFDALRDPIEIVELGGGNGEKLDLLLDAAAARGRDVSVRLVDISQAALDAARERLLARDRPPEVHLTHAPYETALGAFADAHVSGSRLMLFLGSNIGNFDPSEARDLLGGLAGAAGAGGAVLLGVDLVKPEADLLLAYNDPLQVTAAFNRNLLARMNRDLGANFPLDTFAHQAVWSRHASRVEMRLVATAPADIRIPAAGVSTRFEAGEFIWTESSYKYTPARIAAMAGKVGLDVGRQWIDPAAGFALSVLSA